MPTPTPQSSPEVESGILQLLSHRYGDGLVYLRDATERKAYTVAVGRGLISEEGYLTAAGRALLARAGRD